MQMKTNAGTPAQRDELLRKIKTYNPRMTPDKLDALIADQGIEILEISVRGTVEKMAKTANKSRSPLAGLLVGYKDEDMSKKLLALEQELKVPKALADQLSRKLSEQERYDLYERALSQQGKSLSYKIEVKSRRSPLAGLFQED